MGSGVRLIQIQIPDNCPWASDLISPSFSLLLYKPEMMQMHWSAAWQETEGAPKSGNLRGV